MLAKAAATILADLVGDLVGGKNPSVAQMDLDWFLMTMEPLAQALNCLSLRFFYVKEKYFFFVSAIVILVFLLNEAKTYSN